MSKVKCMVEECTYNCGNLCNANEIEVCSCGAKQVNCADETACRTFRGKGAHRGE